MKEKVESEEEKTEEESPRRPVMAADSLRFELEPSLNRVDVDDDDDDDGRAATDHTMASSGGGNGGDDENYDDGEHDEEFFDEIANYFPAASDKATSTMTNAPMYHDDDDDDAVVHKGSTSRHETKLLISFILMVIVGTGNKIFQKLQAIPMYNYPNSMNLIQKWVLRDVAICSSTHLVCLTFHVLTLIVLYLLISSASFTYRYASPTSSPLVGTASSTMQSPPRFRT
jgi:hypothetical protein